jgi:HSP20 family protein
MGLLVKPEPFSQEFDRVFSRLFDVSGGASPQRWAPPMDLMEAEDHFVLRADLPGLSEEDVTIEVQDGALTVSGERAAEHESQEQGWFRIERSFGTPTP